MSYLNQLIDKNNIAEEKHIDIFIHAAEITPPVFDAVGSLLNPTQAGVMNAPHGYFLANVYSMINCWPAAISTLHWAMNNLKVRVFAVSNQMLTFDKNGRSGYRNPILLVRPKEYHKASYINRYYSYFNEIPEKLNVSQHWDIAYINNFVEAGHNAIVYTAPYSGSAQHIQHYLNVLSRIEIQRGRVIDSPKYIMPYFLDSLGFTTAKQLAQVFMPDFSPETLCTDDYEKAHEFLLEHKHIVLKPPHLVSGNEVNFYNLKGKTQEQTQEIIEKFKTDFYRVRNLTFTHGFDYIILQKFISGIMETGETRVFIMDGKVLPIGINMYDQDENKPFKPEHGAKSQEVFLDNETLEVVKTFIDRVFPKTDIFYFGLDVIKEKQEDGSYKCYILEANYGTVGFFPRIAEALKAKQDDVQNYYDNLDPKYKDYVQTDFMDQLIYKPIFETLYEPRKQIHILYPSNEIYGPQINSVMLEYLKKKKEILKRHQEKNEKLKKFIQEANHQREVKNDIILEANKAQLKVTEIKHLKSKKNKAKHRKMKR